MPRYIVDMMVTISGFPVEADSEGGAIDAAGRRIEGFAYLGLEADGMQMEMIRVRDHPEEVCE